MVYQQELGLKEPFIVENGSAAYLPDNYFDVHYTAHREWSGYNVIEMGVPVDEVRESLQRIKEDTGLEFRGYGDMSAEEVAEVTGLDPEAAKRAMEREYSETIQTDFSEDDWQRFTQALQEESLKCYPGGQFCTVAFSKASKGKAVHRLMDLFIREQGAIHALGVGDSSNDEPMLRAVDVPCLVQHPAGTWAPVSLPRLQKIKAAGPAGWQQAVHAFLSAV